MKIKNLLCAALLLALLASCDKNPDPNPVPTNKGNFIVAVTPVAATGVADYLLTTGNLDEGTISTAGKGVEQDGTYRYYVTHKDKFFSMLYGQGNPGAVTVYDIKNGSLNKIANSVTETVQAFTPVNDDILMIKMSRNITNPTASWYQFNTNSLKIEKQGNINTADLNKNGELAHFSWIKQVGNKVYAPYFSIKACCQSGFGTAFPNNAWIAVYSYPEMTLDKIIKDDRTSFIGAYFTDGLEVTENGDVYTFSSSIATSDGKTDFNSTKPAAVTKIKAGTTEFDKSYFLNFEEISSGMNITDWLYVGSNKFIVLTTAKAEKTIYEVGKNIGILDVVAKSFKLVTGAPKVSDIKKITANNYSSKTDQTGYVGINLNSGIGYIYKIDAKTATATQGLKVEGGTITAIEHLN